MEPKASYYPETDTLIIATGETATFLASCGENGCVKVDLDNVEDQYVVGITLLGAAKNPGPRVGPDGGKGRPL